MDQIGALEELYRAYREQGLVVLGFPSNDFLGQEPLSNNEIEDFCSDRYDVSFPLFAKVRVRGRSRHPLYAELSGAGPVRWNYTKFLVDRDGRVIERFGTTTSPTSRGVRRAVEAALGTGR